MSEFSTKLDKKKESYNKWRMYLIRYIYALFFLLKGERGLHVSMVDVQKVEEYQNLLNQLPGVLNSKIVVTNDGSLSEVHILSDVSRSPKQIVRDVQSALLANNNLTVDHKIISIAQIENNNLGVRECRMSIESIQIVSRHTKVEARVSLKKDDQVYEGSYSGGNSASGRMRVVAEAALRAVHQLFDKEMLFALSDVVPVTLANRRAIAVSILYFTQKGDEYLSGSAFVHNDESESVVKATLDAINRKLVHHFDK